MEVILMALFALLGAAIGSFLNVCIDRIPAGKSLVSPPSHCDACGHRLSVKDLIPVFSYLWLRRRCRYCHAPIPWRLFWVELGSGLLLAFVYWRYGLNVDFKFVIIASYCYLFIVLMVIDLEHKLILNKIVYPAMVVALLISIFLPHLLTPPQLRIIPLPWPEAVPWPETVDGVIGGAIGFVFLLIPALIYRGGMGWGDVKMAGLIGLVTGFPMVFVALLMGIILGGLVAGILLLLRQKTRKEPIPFGPFLAVATIDTLLWGNNILGWYLGLL